MKFRVKFGLALLLSVCLCGFLAGILFASGEEYPIPSGAVQKLEKEAAFGPGSAKVRTYSILLTKEKIENFFRKELVKAGWQEKFKAGIVFTKGDKMISVVVLTTKPSPSDKNTYFTVIYATMPSAEAMMAMQKDKPDPVSFMPVYPGAKQMALMDTPGGVMGAYQTEDSINDVVFFYKGKMLAYGWNLYDEKPVGQRKFDCPDCEKKAQSQIQQFGLSQPKGKFYTATLKFQRGQGETCSISITSSQYEEPSASKDARKETEEVTGLTLPASTMTHITVSYKEKK